MNGQNRFVYLVKRMVYRYFADGIPQAAAELSYFLLFSMFPLLMFVNSILARLDISIEGITPVLDMLPRTLRQLIVTYLNQLSGTPSFSPMLIGIGLNLAGPIHEADGREVPGAAWLRGPGGIAPLGADGASREDGDSPTSLDTLRETIAATLATALLAELTALESSLGDAQVAGTRQRYTMSCLTVGQLVRIHPLGGSGGAEQVSGPIGIAQDIDVHGRLVLRDDRGQEVAVDVGDVRHLRPGRLSGVDEGTAAHRGEQEEHTT